MNNYAIREECRWLPVNSNVSVSVFGLWNRRARRIEKIKEKLQTLLSSETRCYYLRVSLEQFTYSWWFTLFAEKVKKTWPDNVRTYVRTYVRTIQYNTTSTCFFICNKCSLQRDWFPFLFAINTNVNKCHTRDNFAHRLQMNQIYFVRIIANNKHPLISLCTRLVSNFWETTYFLKFV